MDRFLAKVNVVDDECWLWTAAIGNHGYGVFMPDIQAGKTVLAHRYMWEQLRGPLDPDVLLHHVCENRRCVRPAHLETMSRSEHASHHRLWDWR